MNLAFIIYLIRAKIKSDNFWECL